MNRTLQPILRKLNAIFAKASGIFCASVRSFDALERHGRGQSQTAKMARDMLDLFEMAQAAHVVDPGAPRSCITADNIRSRWRATASAAVVCRSNRVESTVNSHKEYHHGASHKVVSFEQPRPYAAAGR